MQRQNYIERIFSIRNSEEFSNLALELFRYQAKECSIYKDYIQLLKIAPDSVNSIEKIPFLPIEFFKSHEVKSGEFSAESVFTSSGTTGQTVSKHHVKDLALYEQSFTKTFHLFYGNEKDMVILALLPSYLERTGSSLIYMCESLIKSGANPLSGFYLNEHSQLLSVLQKCKAEKRKTLLIGVTFGLLDFAENIHESFPDLVVMETGGMKGRREEWVRAQVHQYLVEHLGVEKIHSEYGMTELLSQAYSDGDGLFVCPPWMKVLRREVTDPFEINSNSGGGAINIIDLTNFDSCAFIATQDLGKLHSGGKFEILGRYDHAEVRGCNLMVS